MPFWSHGGTVAHTSKADSSPVTEADQAGERVSRSGRRHAERRADREPGGDDIPRIRQHPGQQPAGHLRRLLAGGRLGQEQQEFLAAVAADAVIGAGDAGDDVHEPAQHLVAHRMPEIVVDSLEVVQVDHHDRDRPFAARHVVQRRCQRLVDRTPVEHTGQRIVHGQLLQATGRLVQLAGALTEPQPRACAIQPQQRAAPEHRRYPQHRQCGLQRRRRGDGEGDAGRHHHQRDGDADNHPAGQHLGGREPKPGKSEHPKNCRQRQHRDLGRGRAAGKNQRRPDRQVRYGERGVARLPIPAACEGQPENRADDGAAHRDSPERRPAGHAGPGRHRRQLHHIEQPACRDEPMHGRDIALATHLSEGGRR